MPEVSAPDTPLVVAAFDFDGTLTQRDTFVPFLARGLGWPRFLAALLRCSPWLAGYALRVVPNDVAKGKLMQSTLAGRSLKEMEDWTTRWLAQDFPGQLREATMARLAWHKEAGHCCVMVSASPDIYLPRVAAQLGFDALICTEMEVEGEGDSARLTGRMRTPNCYGEQKVLRLKAWVTGRFGAAALEGMMLYAYGDTGGDKPMLRMADHAWYRGATWDGV
ncbi:phosphatidylglycerophosphatase C [Polaromonas sp. YR568]|uniref:HAD-IB family hydrolase n=1 Tax=Polaromonas sp. YR568 TaxID=1855301 RepID=UPI0008ED1D88|nr:HAD-IB family hydrolase [Polaromonas sp. YR568]SFV03938.1 phosphatidylglycerophosphatase C [Polaromonas sp. YR568]